jgi:hypothetical protein
MLKGTRQFLTRRIYLWLGCAGCNTAFSLIGAGPRQFIVFNLLIALAFSASAFQGTSLGAAENCPFRRETSPPAAGWRPLIRYVMDLIVACYATTVFIDNLAAGSTLLGSLH